MILQQALDVDYDFDIANSNLNYANELISALAWMQDNKMTAIPNVDKFYPYDNLEKQYAAKYLADFAKKIIKKNPNKKVICNFSDLKRADKNM